MSRRVAFLGSAILLLFLPTVGVPVALAQDPTPVPADLNRDGQVDAVDLLLFQSSWYTGETPFPTPTGTPPTPTPTPSASPTPQWFVMAFFGQVSPLRFVADGCSFYEILDCLGHRMAAVGEAVEQPDRVSLEPYVGQKVMVVTGLDVCGWGIGGQPLSGTVAAQVLPIEDPCTLSDVCAQPAETGGIYEGWLGEYFPVVDACSFYRIHDCTGEVMTCVGETTYQALVPYVGHYVSVLTEIDVCGYGFGGQPLYGAVAIDVEVIDPPCWP